MVHRHMHMRRHPRKKHKGNLDYILYFFMVATPLFELPQVWAIYSTQSAEDVSLATWAFFAFSNIAWMAYAIRHKIRPLIITSSMYLAIETSIVVGILMYH